MSHLPTLPEYSKSTFLVVVLSRLSDDSKLKLQDLVQQSSEKAPKAAQLRSEIVHCPDNSTQAAVEKAHTDGSTADIYKVASQARTKGWKKFAVLDALSKRQITGNLFDRETKTHEAVVVGIDVPIDNESQNSEVTGIVARREPLEKAIEWLSKEGTSDLVPWTIKRGEDAVANHAENQYMDHSKAWILHNPKMPFFTTEKDAQKEDARRSRAVDSALDSKPSLPLELKDYISKDIPEDTPIEELTTVPEELHPDKTRLEIHCFELVPDKELASIHAEINSMIKDTPEDRKHQVTSCKIHPWKSQIPGSRANLWQLRDAIAYKHNERSPADAFSIFVLYPSIWNHHKVLLAHTHRPGLFAAVNKIALEDCLLRWSHQFEEYSNLRRLDVQDLLDVERNTVELFIKPSSRFFQDFPQWVPVTPEWPPMPPVFFMSSKFTIEEMNSIKTKLRSQDRYGADDSVGDHGKFFSFVPWEEEEDASMEDMWNMLFKAYNYEGGRLQINTIICVDRQSLEDGRAILADVEWDFEDRIVAQQREASERRSELKGMKFGRLDLCDASIAWINLDVGNSDVEEQCYEETLDEYILPGYTGQFASEDEGDEEDEGDD